jgi:hypothetical protein
MAKFGRFENGAMEPIETYEGDYMRSESSHVRIFKAGQFMGRDDFSDLVVTIRLGKAQSVREIESMNAAEAEKTREGWKVLPTWATLSKFRYSGFVSTGTDIEYGIGFRYKASVSAGEYASLLQHFAGRGEVSIGTGRVKRPTNSVGQWLKDHRGTKPVIVSYVGPILIAEGYAKRGTKSDLIHFK